MSNAVLSAVALLTLFTTATAQRVRLVGGVILMIEMPELFATCSDTDTADGTLVTATVPGVDRFGWTTLLVLEQKRTLEVVDTAAGAYTTVDTVKTCQFHVSP